MTEIGIEQARARLGDLADAAYHHGAITYLTRHGRRIAAITPIQEDAMQAATATTEIGTWVTLGPGDGRRAGCHPGGHRLR